MRLAVEKFLKLKAKAKKNNAFCLLLPIGVATPTEWHFSHANVSTVFHDGVNVIIGPYSWNN